MGKVWTPDEDEVLRKAAASRKSYTEAAALLGRNRNMVAGRANRLDIHFASGHGGDAGSRALASHRSTQG